MARRLNIDADEQGDLAGQGGEHRAVFVYQMASHRYWQDQLGQSDFTYRQFGDNFTVDGFPDGQVCIGERYRIEGAVFEVTQPRVTCYRVGICMKRAQMTALLVAHIRPGFYFRVIEEGEVEAGDERMTVAQINAPLYMPGRPRRELERALRIPAFTPSRAGCRRRGRCARSSLATAWPAICAKPRWCCDRSQSRPDRITFIN